MHSPLFLVNQPRVIPVARIKLAAGSIIVGRSADCDLYLPHLSISRRHAEIHVAEASITVRDLDSRNGTFVDGDRVDSARVTLGQNLRFGGVSFLVTDSRIGADPQDPDIETAGPGEAERAPLPTPPEVVGLTLAQRRVLDLILDGLSEKRVAARLAVSQHTVHNHLREIYRALHVHTRMELFLRLRPRAGESQE